MLTRRGASTGVKIGASIAGVVIVLLAIGAFTVPLRRHLRSRKRKAAEKRGEVRMVKGEGDDGVEMGAPGATVAQNGGR